MEIIIYTVYSIDFSKVYTIDSELDWTNFEKQPFNTNTNGLIISSKTIIAVYKNQKMHLEHNYDKTYKERFYNHDIKLINKYAPIHIKEDEFFQEFAKIQNSIQYQNDYEYLINI